jgi:hypothetical protein
MRKDRVWAFRSGRRVGEKVVGFLGRARSGREQGDRVFKY